MFALSRDGKKVFIHQPDGGIAVPVLLDLDNRKYRIQIPSVSELENDFAVYDSLRDVRRAIGAGGGDQIDSAVEFSREYSSLFRDQLRSGKLTVAALRDMVNAHRRQQAGPPAAARPDRTKVTVSDSRAVSVG